MALTLALDGHPIAELVVMHRLAELDKVSMPIRIHQAGYHKIEASLRRVDGLPLYSLGASVAVRVDDADPYAGNAKSA